MYALHIMCWATNYKTALADLLKCLKYQNILKRLLFTVVLLGFIKLDLAFPPTMNPLVHLKTCSSQQSAAVLQNAAPL